jgi:hypothetical protein
MKHLVGKKITKKVEFMNDEIELRKLSVSEVLHIQNLVKKSNNSKDKYEELDLLRDVTRLAVVGAEELTNEEFDTFPLGELTTLSSEIMTFAGLGDNTAGN